MMKLAFEVAGPGRKAARDTTSTRTAQRLRPERGQFGLVSFAVDPGRFLRLHVGVGDCVVPHRPRGTSTIFS